ncbi:ATPdependent RNA helicase [Kappamyces sp. JEL0829]|nr:ATPdependent RNA helicase [Kappamyces sp. JEL0829]
MSLEDQILYLIENHPVSLVSGDFASSQIAVLLEENGWSGHGLKICQILKSSAACKNTVLALSESHGVNPGDRFGYRLDFEELSSPLTSIVFMCGSLLVKEVIFDPLLSHYTVIIIDDVFWRSIDTDILFAIVKKILKKRPELRIVISCASNDVELYQSYFSTLGQSYVGCLSIQTPQFPVQELFLEKACSDYISQAVEAIFTINDHDPPGDILVFMTGKIEIDTVVSLVSDRRSGKYRLAPFALHGAMSAHELQELAAPTPPMTRKVVVTTNVSDCASLHGITYVVDCGFVKSVFFDPKTMISHLVTYPTSLALAAKRKSLAARTRPGKVYRLYEEGVSALSRPDNIPEIQRCDLTLAALQLKSMGINNLLSFDYISPPNTEILERSLDRLHAMKLIDDGGSLTTKGHFVVQCPVGDISLASMLFNSIALKCSDEVVTIAAMLCIGNFFVAGAGGRFEEVKQRFGVEEGDFIAFVNVYQGYVQGRKSASWCKSNFVDANAMTKIHKLRLVLEKYLAKNKAGVESCGSNLAALQKCILSSLFTNIARASADGSYTLVGADSVKLYIHPTSVLHKRGSPAWIAFHSIEETVKAFMKTILVIDPNWLLEVAPDYYRVRGS